MQISTKIAENQQTLFLFLSTTRLHSTHYTDFTQLCKVGGSVCYRVVPAHRKWQLETAAWNLAGFLHCALETRWQ